MVDNTICTETLVQMVSTEGSISPANRNLKHFFLDTTFASCMCDNKNRVEATACIYTHSYSSSIGDGPYALVRVTAWLKGVSCHLLLLALVALHAACMRGLRSVYGPL